MINLNKNNVFVGNAFSLQMITSDCLADIREVDNFPESAISVVGHQDLANIIGVPYNRTNLKLNKGDVLYVAQYVGGRLPEGCTTLPEGSSIKYFRVEIR